MCVCRFLSLQWTFDLVVLGQLKKEPMSLGLLVTEVSDNYLRYFLFPLSSWRDFVSFVTMRSFEAALRHFLVIHGIDCGLRYHAILFSLKLFVIFCCFDCLNAFFISISALTKLVPLSLQIGFGWPLLPIKRLRSLNKAISRKFTC